MRFNLLITIVVLIAQGSGVVLAFHPCSLLKSRLLKSSRSNLKLDLAPSGSVTGRLENFLSEAASLGAVRFVVVGSGAILETIGTQYSKTVYKTLLRDKSLMM